MKHETDIVVLGAGWVGLCAALSMARRGLQVALIDNRNLNLNISSQLGRVYALNPASLKLLGELEILDKIDTNVVSPYERMMVWVAHSGAEIDFDARLLGASELGVIAEEGPFIQSLFEEVKAHPSITYFPEMTFESIKAEADFISFTANDTLWQAKLAMVADGAHSPFRRQLNIPLTQWSYHQEALVTTVKLEKPHQRTCYQVFLEEGPLAFLPLANPYECAIVWSTSVSRADILISMDEREFNQTLTQPVLNRLGHIQRLGPCSRFPLTMRHTQQYVGERWLLLGDAAHTIHPMAGLGLNMGMADLACWLSHFDKDGLTHVSQALHAFQRERKTKVWETLLTIEALKTLFTTPFYPIKLVRDMGLQVCQQLPVLKRFFIGRASKV